MARIGTALAAATLAAGILGAADAGAAEPRLLYGGEGNRTFLGCLDCGRYDRDSVANPDGPHGSRYSRESVFNPNSEFGSRYSRFSACNRNADSAPVVVDGKGAQHGRLSTNPYARDPVRDPGLRAWIAAVCTR